MQKSLTVLLFTAIVAIAQTVPARTAQSESTGSISGVVLDSQTGSPVPQLPVRTSQSISATTDAGGRYTLHNVPPGCHQVFAGAPIGRDPAFGLRVVTLVAGQDLGSINFRVELKGTISGKVVDENKEPVSGLEVLLVGREYRLGALQYYGRAQARTNDKGEYRIQGVSPGTSYLLLGRQRIYGANPISNVSADPKLRKQTPIPTYYPNSPTPDGATPVLLRAGEQREGMDILMSRTPSYCIEGTLDVEGQPAELTFLIHELQPSFGVSPSGGLAGLPPGGKTGPDGKIRICNLHLGEYRLSAFSGDVNSPAFFGTTLVAITDGDVSKVSVAAQPRLPLSGRVVWAGAPPGKPVESQVSIFLRPLHRAFGGFNSARSSIPGEFSVYDAGFGRTSGRQDNPLMDDYEVTVGGLSGSLYVKDITYGGTSVFRKPLRLGSAITGTDLCVFIGQDGGLLTARVADKNGNPVADCNVVLLPKDAHSEPDLAAMRITGLTDQNGSYSSVALAPGVYYILATTTSVGDTTPESVAKLWGVRSKAKEVQIGPNATVQVALEPIKME